MLVVEDVHWADDASLDALAFVARRIEGLRALLVLTYRDDEVPVVSLLQRVLGGLRAPVAVRIPLGPLSARAVTQLAGEPGAGLRVFASTGGNPFFVTELLAAEQEGLPASVSQAVLARVARLPEPTRALLNMLAVVPARAETGLLDAVFPGWPEAAAAAEERGVLTVHGGAVAFRHELARRAVEEAMPRSRARQLHARVLSALRASGADPVRLVHHAERAGDDDALLVVAPLAARAAAAAGAHREAAAHYGRALKLADRYPEVERADLLEAFTVEASTTCLIGEAMQAAEGALALREAQGDPSGVGRNLRWMSSLAWLSGRRADMERRLTAALEVLEVQPPGPDLAMAYSDLAVRIGLYGGQREEAERAVADAVSPGRGGRRPGRARLRARAGSAWCTRRCSPTTPCCGAASTGPAGPGSTWKPGWRTRGWPGTPCCAGTGRPPGAGSVRASSTWSRGRYWARCGTCAGCRRRPSWPPGTGLRPRRRRAGCWRNRVGRAITGVHAPAALARLHVRRGDAEKATTTVQELWEVAETCGLLHHVAPAATALAEHAELTGRVGRRRAAAAQHPRPRGPAGHVAGR